MALKPEILAPVPGGGKWELNDTRVYSVDTLSTLPKQCYIFLNVNDYSPTADGRRQKLAAHFKVPDFVANRTCFELNGFFGNKATYADEETSGGHLTSYTTWFRCLIKMVKKVDEGAHDDRREYVKGSKGYSWFEMTFFTRWDYPNSSQVLCVDVPPDFASELQTLLNTRAEPVDFRDPYAMHTSLIDNIIVHADVSVWRVRDPVRLLEKHRMRIGSIFGPIHEMSRHAIHKSEVLEATIDTLKDMQECRTVIQGRLREDLGKTYREQSKDHAQFQISLVRSLKLRSDSNHKRLENEINLAFNNLARQDNNVMKSIALLTMIFLPATFISAIFSTTFFNFSDEGSWEVSDKIWIYWTTIVPATLATVLLWRFWLPNSDAITRFFRAQYQGVTTLWKGLGERRARQRRVSEKVGQA